MTLVLEPTFVPIREDKDGTLRVGKTRVMLDTVIAAWWDGAVPEEIVLAYPTLKVADVYSVLAYYLANHDSVRSYLDQRREQANLSRRKIESDFPVEGLRARLMARRTKSSKPFEQ